MPEDFGTSKIIESASYFFVVAWTSHHKKPRRTRFVCVLPSPNACIFVCNYYLQYVSCLCSFVFCDEWRKVHFNMRHFLFQLRTLCFTLYLGFPACKSRKIALDFLGGNITSNGGTLLLKQADAKLGLSRAAARTIPDFRRQASVNHTIEQIDSASMRLDAEKRISMITMNFGMISPCKRRAMDEACPNRVKSSSPC